MSGEELLLSDAKKRSYLYSGLALLLAGLLTGGLNLLLTVPDYQKVSWLMVGFFLVAGVGAVGSSRGVLPQAGKAIEYGEALVVAVVLAIAIRGSVIQAFKIPSGSMLPTLLIGDHLLVNKFLYGVRIPYTGTRVARIRAPRRGDIVVFAYPVDDTKDFIKRVIGEPGDQIQVRDKMVYVNDNPLVDPWGNHVDPTVFPEGFEKRDNFGPITVPPGKYFVMGDNRDKSYDSRFWGFVDDARIKGRAFVLYWSWDSETIRPRIGRLGNLIR